MRDGQDTEIEAYRRELFDLRTEHRDLDDAIAALLTAGSRDHIQMQRLKKRKLVLKDQISRLESLLLPDITA
jgi:hypothetical protein